MDGDVDGTEVGRQPLLDIGGVFTAAPARILEPQGAVVALPGQPAGKRQDRAEASASTMKVWNQDRDPHRCRVCEAIAGRHHGQRAIPRQAGQHFEALGPT